jgi:hypothetical protein
MVYILIGMIVGAVILVFYAMSCIYKSSKTYQWTPVSLHMHKLQLSRRDEFGGGDTGPLTIYYPVIEYSYSVQGSSYTKSAIYFDKKSAYRSTETDARNLMDEISSCTECFFNPRNPDEVVVMRGLYKKRRSHFVALSVSGALQMGVCVMLLLAFR